jgi:hypothetical protein
MTLEQVALELLRGLFLPLAVAAVVAVFTVLVIDRYKAGRQYQTLLENLRRELRLAILSHPINVESAQHLTGAFVPYPVSTPQRLLIEPVTTKRLPAAFVNSLQEYTLEALRINSLIENAKLHIGAGQNLGSMVAGNTTELLRKALVSESRIEKLINAVIEQTPK